MASKASVILLTLVFLAIGTQSQAAIISFDFLGTAGSDLDGSSSGSTSSTAGGITLTLNAIAQVAGTTGTFNQNGTPADDFGINAIGAGDETDALDGDNGIESIVFSVTSSVPLSVLTLDSFDFDRITAAGLDSGSLVFDGGSTLNFDNSGVSGSDLLTVNESLTTGQDFTLSFVAGNGFGLETLTFTATATAVPEPSSLLALSCTGLFVCAVRQRRKSRQANAVDSPKNNA